MTHTRTTSFHYDGVRIPKDTEASQLLSYYRSLIAPAPAQWENADPSVSYTQSEEGQVELLVEFTFYAGDDDSQEFFNPDNTLNESEKFPTHQEAQDAIERHLTATGSYVQSDEDLYA